MCKESEKYKVELSPTDLNMKSIVVFLLKEHAHIIVQTCFFFNS